MPKLRKAQTVCTAVVLTFTGPASAEWFLDFYAGRAFMESADIEIRTDDVPVSGVDALRVDFLDVESDDYSTVGLRVGRWFETAPDIGLALDVFRFAPDIGSQTIRGSATGAFSGDILDTPVNFVGGVSGEVPIPGLDIPSIPVPSLELMLRRPLLTSSAFPHGRLRPYISAGPAFLLRDVEPEVALGVKVSGGLAWQINNRILIFGEYRFTHFGVDTESGGVNIAGVETGDLEMQLDVNTHYILTGLSFQLGE